MSINREKSVHKAYPYPNTQYVQHSLTSKPYRGFFKQFDKRKHIFICRIATTAPSTPPAACMVSPLLARQHPKSSLRTSHAHSSPRTPRAHPPLSRRRWPKSRRNRGQSRTCLTRRPVSRTSRKSCARSKTSVRTTKPTPVWH